MAAYGSSARAKAQKHRVAAMVTAVRRIYR
jgi:hypothetical protein